MAWYWSLHGGTWLTQIGVRLWFCQGQSHAWVQSRSIQQLSPAHYYHQDAAQRWFNARPASLTLARHCTSAGSASRVSCAGRRQVLPALLWASSSLHKISEFLVEEAWFVLENHLRRCLFTYILTVINSFTDIRMSANIFILSFFIFYSVITFQTPGVAWCGIPLIKGTYWNWKDLRIPSHQLNECYVLTKKW